MARSMVVTRRITNHGGEYAIQYSILSTLFRADVVVGKVGS